MSLARDSQPYDTAGAGARQAVASPEHVTLEFPLAGPSARIMAYGIDYLLIVVAQVALFIVLMAAGPLADWMTSQLGQLQVELESRNPKTIEESTALFMLIATFVVVGLVIEWGYFLCVEYATGGRSLGKAIVRLRVLRDDGLPITLRDCAVRNLLRAVDMLPSSYLVGLVAMIASPQGKRLGDLAAGTIVVRLDRQAPVAPLATPVGVASSFRFERDQLARIGNDERQLLRQTLRRIETLTPEQARDALERATRALCNRLGYAPVEPREQADFLRALLAAIEKR